MPVYFFITLVDFYDTPKTTRKPVKKRNTVAFNDSEIPLIERDIIDDNEINRSLEKDVNVLGKLSKTPPPFPEGMHHDDNTIFKYLFSFFFRLR